MSLDDTKRDDAYWAEVEKRLQGVASRIVRRLVTKGRMYNESWRKRGGVDSFMMMARKWDRIEEQAGRFGFNSIRLLREHEVIVDGPKDDVEDLAAYCLLHLEYVERFVDTGEPSASYTNQGDKQ